MGGAYLPWFISSISTAILADIILSVFGYDRAIPQVVSWALMQLGSRRTVDSHMVLYRSFSSRLDR